MGKKILAITLGLFTLLSNLAPAIGDAVTVNADVDKYLVATFNYNTVAFGTLTHNTQYNTPTVNHTTGEYNVTVDTNYNYTIAGSGTDPTGTVSSFGIGNVSLAMNVVAGSLDIGDSLTLSTSPQTVEDDVSYTQTNDYHGYWMDVPNAQYAESYSSTVTITYSSMA